MCAEILLMSKDTAIYLSDKTKKNIAVYQNNYWQGHRAVMKSHFHRTQNLLGEDAFDYLVSHYLKLYPPKYENVDEYGDLFPDFLQQCPDLEDYPQVPPYAKVELWNFRRIPESVVEVPQGTFQYWEKKNSGEEEDKVVWDFDRSEFGIFNESATHYRVAKELSR